MTWALLFFKKTFAIYVSFDCKREGMRGELKRPSSQGCRKRNFLLGKRKTSVIFEVLVQMIYILKNKIQILLENMYEKYIHLILNYLEIKL